MSGTQSHKGQGGEQKQLDYHSAIKKEGCGIRWFHMLSQSGR